MNKSTGYMRSAAAMLNQANHALTCCVADALAVRAERDALKEVLAVLMQELPPFLSPEAQVAWVRAERLLEGGGNSGD